MNEIIIQILEVVVMLAVVVCARYVIPWLKAKIGSDNLANAAVWTEKAVLYAQQVLTSSSGAAKKEAVVAMLKEILAENNVNITDEQLDVLIEAAVKAMKISENAGVTINTTTVED